MQVSTKGGVFPHWKVDGRELFYLSPSTMSVMSTKLSLTPTLRVGLPEELFPAPAGATGWDVARDGSRFYFITGDRSATPPFTVMLNWQAVLPR